MAKTKETKKPQKPKQKREKPTVKVKSVKVKDEKILLYDPELVMTALNASAATAYNRIIEFSMDMDEFRPDVSAIENLAQDVQRVILHTFTQLIEGAERREIQ